jgi:hypothetical protein
MSLKTKERCGKAGDKAGISLKINDLALNYGNLIENKGG